MTPFKLHLVPHAVADAEPAAWWLPGGDPTAWLDELLLFGVALERVRLVPVPRSRRDPTPRGALALLAPGERPRQVRCAHAYAVRAGRLFHPRDAAVQPEATDDELIALLPWPQALLHPVVGLVGFTEQDTLMVADLLDVAPQAVDWGRARAGTAATGGLRSVVPAQPPQLQDLFADAQDAIGSADPSAIPKRRGEAAGHSDGEPRPSWLQRLRDGALRALCRAIDAAERRRQQRLTRSTRNRAPTRGPAAPESRLVAWARRTLARLRAAPARIVSSGLSVRRQRELQRLWHLLEANPDEGLRFALPLGGGSSRGVAAPGDTLGRRQTDFDLRRLGGGGPADAWHLDWQQHLRLRAKYLDLAAREAQLGRHRRAAYVYAHLLNDLHSAARMLQQGGCPREAAVIYRDRLNDLTAAAKCLVAGGLVGEAADLFEQREHYEDAGDLRLVLRHHEHAERLYRRALAQKVADDDLVGASMLQAEKLAEPDPAIQRLRDAWEAGDGSTRTLGAMLALQARLGRDDELRAAIDRCTATGTAHQRILAATVVAELLQHAPDPSLQPHAADRVRANASALLQSDRHLDERDVARLLRAIRSLDSADSLLARDTWTFVAARQKRPPAQPPKPLVAMTQPPSLRTVLHVALPAQATWKFAAATTSRLVLAGTTADGGGCYFTTTWDDVRPAPAKPILRPFPGRPIAVMAPRSSYERFAIAIDGARSQSVLLPDLEGSARDITLNPVHPTIAWARDDEDSFWLLVRAGHNLQLDHLDAAGNLRATTLVAPDQHGLAELQLTPGRVRMAATRGHVAIGLGHDLLVFGPDGKARQIQCPAPIHLLQASAQHTRPRFLLGVVGAGIAIVDVPSTAHDFDALDRALPHWFGDLPVATFAGGDLVLATANDGLRAFLARSMASQPSEPDRRGDQRALAIVPAWDARYLACVEPKHIRVVEVLPAKG